MKKAEDREGTIFADGKKLALDSRINNHVMIVGASGRGKTRNVIKPNIMQLNSNYVISDPKGTLIYELGTMLRKKGYTIKVLNLVDLSHSNKYNPLKYIKEDYDVIKLAKYIIANVTNGKEGNDPFWNLAAENLICAICFLVLKEYDEKKQNFKTVLDLLQRHRVFEFDSEEDSELDLIFRALEERNPNHIAVKYFKIFKCGAEKTASSILITAETYLQWFNLEEYALLTDADELDLSNISREKTALFVITSDTDKSKNWLAGIFYCQLLDILCNQENPMHVRLILDDFVCTAKIPDFDYIISMIRSRNISAFISIQDEAQLEKEYGSAAKGIISNCDNYIFLGSTNIDSCDIAAHRLGDSNINGQYIRQMGYDECVVISGNSGGIFKKYDITKHKNYSEIADSKDSKNFFDFKNEFIITADNSLIYIPNVEKDDGLYAKESVFDSNEEEYFFHILNMHTNLNIHIHQHLRDIFKTNNKSFSKKINLMHCDFIVRDTKERALFGIELDGQQHEVDETQIINDKLKDFMFQAIDLPLLRIRTTDLKKDAKNVITKVLDTASRVDGIEYKLLGEPESYYSWLLFTKRVDIDDFFPEESIEELQAAIEENLTLTEDSINLFGKMVNS